MFGYADIDLSGALDDLSAPQTSLPAGGLNDWGSWFQKTASAVIGTGLNTYQYGQLAQAGGIPAVSPSGQIYTEGQRASVAYGAGAGGISPVLLIGAAVAIAALLILKK